MKLKDGIDTGKIKKNYILNASYQILTLITPFFTMPYVSRVLGAGQLGTFSYIESVVAYFMLFAALGISTYGQREVSYISESREKLTELFWNTKIFQFLFGFASLIVYVIFSIRHDNGYLYILFSFNILAVMADVSWVYYGCENFGSVVKKDFIFKAISICMIFIFVKNENDLWKYILILAAAYFFSNASLWINISKYIDAPDIKKIRPFNNCKSIFILFIPTIAIQLSMYLDKTMIGIITESNVENGYYEQATKICRMVMTLVTSLSTVMIPRIGSCFAKKDTGTVHRLMMIGYRFVFMMGVPLCVGLIAVSPDFVPWFFGPGYEKSIPLIQILSFLILAIGINNMTGMQYLVPTGRQNIYTVTVIAGAVINIALNCILIPGYLSIGAAVASVLAESCIAVLQLIFVRRELPVKNILKNSYRYICSGIVMYIVLRLEKDFLLYNMQAVISILLMVITGVVVYFAMLFIMKDEFFMENCRQIFRKR